eukprot:scaffold57177_cov17-Tisochrysis_lutea.AAC.2
MQGMAAVQQVVSHMLLLLSAAHKEELAFRSGSSGCLFGRSVQMQNRCQWAAHAGSHLSGMKNLVCTLNYSDCSICRESVQT